LTVYAFVLIAEIWQERQFVFRRQWWWR